MNCLSVLIRVEYLADRGHVVNAHAAPRAGRRVGKSPVFEDAYDEKVQHGVSRQVFASTAHVVDSRLLGMDAVGLMQIVKTPVVAGGHDFARSTGNDGAVLHFHVGLGG